MRKLAIGICASLLSLNANAIQDLEKKNPELWVCKSTNTRDVYTMYFVYLEQNYIFFGPSGGFLGSGTWQVIQSDTGQMTFETDLLLRSGYRRIRMWVQNETTFHMQILFPENKTTGEFLCT